MLQSPGLLDLGLLLSWMMLSLPSTVVAVLILTLVALRSSWLIHHIIHHHRGHLASLGHLTHLTQHHLHILGVHHLHRIHHRSHHKTPGVDLAGLDLLQGIQTVFFHMVGDVKILRIVK